MTNPTRPATAFSDKCPQCGGYNARIRTELVSYDEKPDATGAQEVLSKTRIYHCNACQHVWSETIAKSA
jgi:rubrerythrin